MEIFIVLGVILFIAIVVICNYNSLIKSKLKTKNAWSQIDILLQKRYELIPNLVEIVKGYAKHESTVLENIVKLRLNRDNTSNIGTKLEVEKEMSDSIKYIMAIAESYPELKANQNFLALQNELSELESKIAFARQFFNDTVTIYNTKIEVFPSNLFAKLFGFQEVDLFQMESNDVKNNINVNFNQEV